MDLARDILTLFKKKIERISELRVENFPSVTILAGKFRTVKVKVVKLSRVMRTIVLVFVS